MPQGPLKRQTASGRATAARVGLETGSVTPAARRAQACSTSCATNQPTFTLDELAAAYAGADRWVQETLAERDTAPGWPTRLTTVQDAAFHVYSRGAVDYRP
jgi:hypothetical protein